MFVSSPMSFKYSLSNDFFALSISGNFGLDIALTFIAIPDEVKYSKLFSKY